MAKQRTLADTAADLQKAAALARHALAHVPCIPAQMTADATASELAQAVVLITRAAARFGFCGALAETVKVP